MARYPLSLPTQLKQEAETLAAQQGVSLNQFILWAVAEKVGALGQKLDDPAFPQITYRRGAVRNTRTESARHAHSGQDDGRGSQMWGMSPAEIADQYDISERLVKEALAFYEAHREEIDASIGCR